MSPSVTDITIAGAGPAGLALAAALADRGVRVIVVDPEPDAPWTNRYGAWEHDLRDLDIPVERRFPRTWVDVGQGRQVLPGAYTVVDRGALQQSLRDRVGPALIAGRAVDVQHDPNGSLLRLADGRRIRSRAVVHATGRGGLVATPRAPRVFQAALGRLVRADHPFAPGEAALMDFSTAHLDPAEAAGPPSFLYALPVDAEHVFVEETSLAAAPAVPLDRLAARLDRRLDHLGVHVHEVLDTERCLIPMDVAPPARGRTLAVGAAAGWVHPATGYQLTRALRAAPAVADALVAGLDESPDHAAFQAWRAIWPTAERRTRALHDLGLGLLLDFDSEQIQAFFAAFFSIPEPSWRAYLDATSSPLEVAGAMRRVFAALPNAPRTAVALHALGRGPALLLGAITPQSGGAS